MPWYRKHGLAILCRLTVHACRCFLVCLRMRCRESEGAERDSTWKGQKEEGETEFESGARDDHSEPRIGLNSVRARADGDLLCWPDHRSLDMPEDRGLSAARRCQLPQTGGVYPASVTQLSSLLARFYHF